MGWTIFRSLPDFGKDSLVVSDVATWHLYQLPVQSRHTMRMFPQRRTIRTRQPAFVQVASVVSILPRLVFSTKTTVIRAVWQALAWRMRALASCSALPAF